MRFEQNGGIILTVLRATSGHLVRTDCLLVWVQAKNGAHGQYLDPWAQKFAGVGVTKGKLQGPSSPPPPQRGRREVVGPDNLTAAWRVSFFSFSSE